MERFLERVSLSDYKNIYIIKGGFLISSMVGLLQMAALESEELIEAFMKSNEVPTALIIDLVELF